MNGTFCACCGKEFDENEFREVSKDFSQSGYSPYCIQCESDYFNKLAEVEGRPLALFMVCGAYNAPLLPAYVDNETFMTTDTPWIYYISQLIENKQYYKRGKPQTFFKTETYLLKLLGREMTEKDFAKYIFHEKKRLDEENRKKEEEESKKQGSVEQREKWGEMALYPELPMTDALYNELDRQYENKAVDFKGTTLTAVQKDTLVKVARLNVIYDYLISQGNIKDATATQKTVDMLLASEQMRKKDEKAVEAYRIDTQVVALEKAGFMENGKLLPMDNLIQAIMNNCVKKKKYDYTLDACDEMIERMWNTIRQNADLFIQTELPAELKVEDTWGEFADKKSEGEKENERFTGATKIRFRNDDDME